jgi:hypothetical protein
MTERKTTIVCTFDPTAPRLNAFDVHNWIYDELRLSPADVLAIQMDGFKRSVYIKLIDQQAVTKVLLDTSGRVKCKHTTGEVSYVSLDTAGMGFKRVRVASLPVEAPDHVLKTALAPYGQVFAIKAETWPSVYKYVVTSGIRYVSMSLHKHIPSQLVVNGDRVLLSYEGQPQTCFRCGEGGHLSPTCPVRRAQPRLVGPLTKPTYASVVTPDSQRRGSINLMASPDVSDTAQDCLQGASPDDDCSASRTDVSAHDSARVSGPVHDLPSMDIGEPESSASTCPSSTVHAIHPPAVHSIPGTTDTSPLPQRDAAHPRPPQMSHQVPVEVLRSPPIDHLDAMQQDTGSGLQDVQMTTDEGEDVCHTRPSTEHVSRERRRRGTTDTGLPDRGGRLRSASQTQGGEERAPDLWSDDQDPVDVPTGVQAAGTQPKRLKTTREAGRNDKPPGRQRSKSRTILSGAR